MGTGTNEQDETSSFSENICDKSHAEFSHRCFAQAPIQHGLLIQAIETSHVRPVPHKPFVNILE